MSNKDVNGQSGLSSIWTESLANNKQPDDKALLAHLRTVHQNNAGFTEKCASSCRDKTGRNSYEWLAEIVPNIDGIRVLDLACGSGPLLKILYDRNKKLRLKGVDMCPEELALAKTRLPDGVVDLLELKAQSLTLVDNNSIDVVLCHWALTLMNPITPVLNEVRRVLSSGGRFAALVNGPMDAAPGYGDVHNLIYEYVQAKLPKYGEIDLGDPRIRSTDSLRNLLSEAFPNAKVNIETSVVSMEGPVAEVAETAAGFFYASFVLQPEIRRKMLSEISDLLDISKQNENLERQGRFAMPISRLVVEM
jgi:ubiquinone/menaquinone biosynthesis C-methylase UbiE